MDWMMVRRKTKIKSVNSRFTPKVPRKALNKMSNFLSKLTFIRMLIEAVPEERRLSSVPKTINAIKKVTIKRFFFVAKTTP